SALGRGVIGRIRYCYNGEGWRLVDCEQGRGDAVRVIVVRVAAGKVRRGRVAARIHRNGAIARRRIGNGQGAEAADVSPAYPSHRGRSWVRVCIVGNRTTRKSHRNGRGFLCDRQWERAAGAAQVTYATDRCSRE